MRGAHTIRLPHAHTSTPAAHTPPTRRPHAACASLSFQSSPVGHSVGFDHSEPTRAFAFWDAQVLSLNEALKAQDTARYAVVQELRSNSQMAAGRADALRKQIEETNSVQQQNLEAEKQVNEPLLRTKCFTPLPSPVQV